jgi:hypothetical protein
LRRRETLTCWEEAAGAVRTKEGEARRTKKKKRRSRRGGMGGHCDEEHEAILWQGVQAERKGRFCDEAWHLFAQSGAG